MTPAALFIAALIALAAVGLVVWAWLTIYRIGEDLRSIGGFEGRHFEIGPQAAKRSGVAR